MTPPTITAPSVTPPRAAAPTPGRPERSIVTRAERAECTCPEACERDHEWD